MVPSDIEFTEGRQSVKEASLWERYEAVVVEIQLTEADEAFAVEMQFCQERLAVAGLARILPTRLSDDEAFIVEA